MWSANMALLDAAAGALERGMLRLLSPGGGPKLSILIYHRVLPQTDPLFPGEVDRVAFNHQMALVKSRFNVLPLLDAVRLARAGELPPRAACITFDDGYADNAEVALPLLQQHGLHATFFIATGFLNGGRMWNDSVIELVRRLPGPQFDATSLGLGSHQVETIEQRRQAIHELIRQLKYVPMDERLQQVDKLVALAGLALPDDLMMSTGQLHKLRDAGMGIGAHTVNHPILARLPADQARDEIAKGKQELEALIGGQVPLFAYPNGKPGEDYLSEHVQMVRELGFEGAVSTAWGSGGDTFQLPRFTPWDRNRLRFLLRLSRNLTFSASSVA
jgi:peptidoglycan/xylan/chitin deacetylase (PgdA/CDA1 family)